MIELRWISFGVYASDDGYSVRRAPAGGWDVFRPDGLFIGWKLQRGESLALIEEDANERRQECQAKPD